MMNGDYFILVNFSQEMDLSLVNYDPGEIGILECNGRGVGIFFSLSLAIDRLIN